MSVKQTVAVHIRWMIRRDMPEVLAVEAESFPQPWAEEDFLRCLREHNCIGMVAEIGDTVLGYMIYELFKRRLHVINLAVAETARRHDVGGQMVRRLKGKLSSHRRTALTADLREGNLGAQLFFRSQGFLATRIRKGFFEDSGEDAYRFRYDMPREEVGP